MDRLLLPPPPRKCLIPLVCLLSSVQLAKAGPASASASTSCMTGTEKKKKTLVLLTVEAGYIYPSIIYVSFASLEEQLHGVKAKLANSRPETVFGFSCCLPDSPWTPSLLIRVFNLEKKGIWDRNEMLEGGNSFPFGGRRSKNRPERFELAPKKRCWGGGIV